MAQNKNLNTKLEYLAHKYYGKTLSNLTSFQLDKVVTWATGTNPEKGKNQARKAQNAITQNRKYRGKTQAPEVNL